MQELYWIQAMLTNEARLCAYVRSFATDANEAAELIQATWCVAWDIFGASTTTQLEWPDVLRCCRKAAGDHARLRRREARALLALCDDHSDAVEIDERRVGEDCKRAWACLLLLPAKQQQVVALRLLADKSEKETAAVMGCAVGTVKVHYHRGLARLRSLAWEAPSREFRT